MLDALSEKKANGDHVFTDFLGDPDVFSEAELEDSGYTTHQQTMIPIGNNIPANHVNHLEIEENRKQLGLSQDAILLGFFGFFNSSKGGDDLIKLIQQLGEPYHLIVIGGSAGDSDSLNNQIYIDGVKEQIESLGIEDRIHWTDYLPQNRVSSWKLEEVSGEIRTQ